MVDYESGYYCYHVILAILKLIWFLYHSRGEIVRQVWKRLVITTSRYVFIGVGMYARRASNILLRCAY